MKCESCKSNDATVRVKQVADGLVKEVNLCAACAEQNGLKSPAAMADFFFGAGSPVPVRSEERGPQKSCPVCHMREGDYQKTNRLGCESCYETFSEQLIPLVDNMHRSTRHVGKTPSHEKTRSQMENLRIELQKAVNRQAFEEAAEIRDRIKALEVQ
jgi:protein arginine kinase activator